MACAPCQARQTHDTGTLRRPFSRRDIPLSGGPCCSGVPVEHLLSREPAHSCAQITMNSFIESVVSQFIVGVLVAVTLAALAAARARWARKGKSRALTPPPAGGEPPCRPAGHETHHLRHTRRTRRVIQSSHGRRKESSS